MTFAEKLLKLRKREGISQEELANRLEVSRQAVSRWELGTAMPDALKLFQLSRIFGVAADYLLDDEQAEIVAPEIPQPVSQQEPKRFPIVAAAGGILAGLGAVGALIIAILASVKPVYITATYEIVDGVEVMVTPAQSGIGTFLSAYNLGWLWILCIACVAVGVGIVLLPRLMRCLKKSK